MRAAATVSTLGALALTVAAVAPASGSTATSTTARATAAPAARSAAASAAGDPAEARGARIAAKEAAAAGIDWSACAPVEELSESVRCGTVSVPVDYAKPHGEHLDLTVSRARATGSAADHQGPLLYNPGGPGGSGMRFPLYGQRLGGTWKKLNESYDFVGYAPRGVGRSAPVSCQDPKEYVRGPNRSPREPSPEFQRTMRQRAAEYARGCLRDQGDRLAHFTTPDNARDLDLIRAALGQKKINYLGVSYGSYLGSVYATLFPGRVRRLVLDSVVNPDPAKIWYQANLDQNLAFQRRWTDWKTWVASHDSVYGLGGTPGAVQANFDRVREAVDKDRDDGGVGSHELLAGYLSVGYSDRAWARAAHVLAEYRKGNRQPLTTQVAPDLSSAAAAENGDAVYHAVECADAPWPRTWHRWLADNTAIDAVAPFETWENAWLNLPCAYWQGEQSQPVDVGTGPGALPPVLLLAATRDAATPYEGALETQRRLSGSSLVTERGAGQHGLAGGPSECVNRHLEKYLLEGSTSGRRSECAAHPEPEPVYGKAETGKSGKSGGAGTGLLSPGQASPATSSWTGFRRPV